MTAADATAEVSCARVRPARRWRQFSLRTLLLAMVALSIVFALFALRLQRARKQAAAVATIRKLGGSVVYDYQRLDPTMSNYDSNAESPVPGWLLKSLGEDFFHEVTGSSMNRRPPESAAEVQAYWSAIGQLKRIDYLQTEGEWVDGRTATDALRHHRHMRELWLIYGNLRGTDLEPLSSLKSLETLYLDRNPIGDDGAKYLSNLPKLTNLTLRFTEIGDECIPALITNRSVEALRLDSTQVSDRGVVQLTSLTKLRTLGLAGTQITDESLRRLAKLKEMDFLVLMGTDISDRGLAHLSSLSKLQTLDIRETRVSGVAFRELQSLANLEVLQLGGKAMTDEGAQWAMRLPRLKFVDFDDSPLTMDGFSRIEWPTTLETVTLTGTGLTDDDLMRLAKCPNLKSVGLNGTKVTPQGIKRFQQAQPGVTLRW